MCVVGTQFRVAALPVSLSVSSTILEYHSLRISLTVSSTITIQSVEYHNQSYMSVVTENVKENERRQRRKRRKMSRFEASRLGQGSFFNKTESGSL